MILLVSVLSWVLCSGCMLIATSTVEIVIAFSTMITMLLLSLLSLCFLVLL